MGKFTSSPSSHDPAAVAAWQQKLAGLASDVKAWSEQQQWEVVEEQRTISENGTPPYPVAALQITLPKGEVRLEPITMGGQWWAPRVELAAWPSLHRVYLIDQGGEWRIQTLSGIDYPMPWNRDTFLHLARALATAP